MPDAPENASESRKPSKLAALSLARQTKGPRVKGEMPGPLSANPYKQLPVGTLKTLQTAYVQGILDIVQAGKSWSMNGTSYTRADLPQLNYALFWINQAIDNASGQITPRLAHPVFPGGGAQSRFDLVTDPFG